MLAPAFTVTQIRLNRQVGKEQRILKDHPYIPGLGWQALTRRRIQEGLTCHADPALPRTRQASDHRKDASLPASGRSEQNCEVSFQVQAQVQGEPTGVAVLALELQKTHLLAISWATLDLYR